MRQWLLRVFKKRHKTNPRPAAPPRRQARLGVEALEVRQVMTAALGAAAALHQVVPPSAPAQAQTVKTAPMTNGQLQFNTSNAPTSQQTPATPAQNSAVTGPQALAGPFQNAAQPGAMPVQAAAAAANPVPDPGSIQDVTVGGQKLQFGLDGTDATVLQSTDGKTWQQVPGFLGQGQPPAMSSFSVDVNPDGKTVALTGLGKDGHLYQAQANSPNGWVDMNFPGQAASYKTATYSNGNSTAFVVDTQGNLFQETSSAGPHGLPMHQWRQIGFGGQTSEVQVGKEADGRLTFFAASRTGGVTVGTQHDLSAQDFDLSSLGDHLPVSGLQVGQDSAGRLELFGISPRDEGSGISTPTIFRALETGPGTGSFGSWEDLHHSAFSIAVGQNPAGQLQLFGTWLGGQINTVAQTDPGQFPSDGWTTLQALPNSPGSIASISTRQEGGNLVLHVSGQTQTGPGTFEATESAAGWSPWQSVGAAAPLPGAKALTQPQLSPQQLSDALKVRPHSSSQLTQDLENAAQAHVLNARQANPNTLAPRSALSNLDLGGLGQDHVSITPQALADAIQHTLDRINDFRAGLGLGALVLDDQINAFATAGSQELTVDHIPHQHFSNALASGELFSVDGFRGQVAENQSDAFGQPPFPGSTINDQIDQILTNMEAEGPSGIHYQDMANPAVTRLGVGLVTTPDGNLYFTTDFSG